MVPAFERWYVPCSAVSNAPKGDAFTAMAVPFSPPHVMMSSQSCAKNRGAFISLARCSNTLRTSPSASPTTTGVPDLMIPAFSRAMSAGVFPSSWVWSRDMFVITHMSGERMLVLSSRPPRPVSTTDTSTLCRAKQSKAIIVVSSKNDGHSLLSAFRL